MNRQPDLFSRPYPEGPGWKEPTTSRAAAESVAGGSWEFKAKILKLLAAGGRTADEIATHFEKSVLYVRPRVAELAASGRIANSGQRRKNASMRAAIVWIIKPERSPT